MCPLETLFPVLRLDNRESLTRKQRGRDRARPRVVLDYQYCSLARSCHGHAVPPERSATNVVGRLCKGNIPVPACQGGPKAPKVELPAFLSAAGAQGSGGGVPSE